MRSNLVGSDGEYCLLKQPSGSGRVQTIGRGNRPVKDGRLMGGRPRLVNGSTPLQSGRLRATGSWNLEVQRQCGRRRISAGLEHRGTTSVPVCVFRFRSGSIPSLLRQSESRNEVLIRVLSQLPINTIHRGLVLIAEAGEAVSFFQEFGNPFVDHKVEQSPKLVNGR